MAPKELLQLIRRERKPLGPAASPGIYDNDQLDSMLAARKRRGAFTISRQADGLTRLKVTSANARFESMARFVVSNSAE